MAWWKKERFSLGYFDREYISRAPIATLSDADGKIIAFTTFMPVYQNGSLSVDLMRYYPDAPSGIMDAIFIHLFQWAKKMNTTPLISVWHHFQMLVYPHSLSGLNEWLLQSLITFVIRIVSADYDILKKNINQHGAVNI